MVRGGKGRKVLMSTKRVLQRPRGKGKPGKLDNPSGNT